MSYQSYTTKRGYHRQVGGISLDTKMVGSRIRDIRQQRGLTQAELAQQVNMSLKHISAIECGIRLPSLDTLITIANELQIDTNTLLQDSLAVSTQLESSTLWAKIESLSPQKQKKILRMLQVLMEEE